MPTASVPTLTNVPLTLRSVLVLNVLMKSVVTDVANVSPGIDQIQLLPRNAKTLMNVLRLTMNVKPCLSPCGRVLISRVHIPAATA